MPAITEDTFFEKRKPELAITVDTVAVESGYTVYIGALVSRMAGNDGFCRPAVSGAVILGIAETHAEEGEYPTLLRNIVVRLPFFGITPSRVGLPAYAVNSGEVDGNPTSSLVGRVVGWEPDYAWVHLTCSLG